MSTPLNVAIIGPSGAGKGTHAAGLCSRFRLRHVATGDLFRDNLANHTALGILARNYMERGELVPDEVVDAMIEEWCERLPLERGALFDGFPRTVYQARFLERLLEKQERRLDAVIYLTVPDEEIARRLAGRYICRSCQQPYHLATHPSQVYGVCDECGGTLYHRGDDNSEMIATRLRVFHRTTDPVLEYYAAANKLIIISGEGDIVDVDARMIRALEGVRNRTYLFATASDVAGLPKPRPASIHHKLRHTKDLILLGAPGCGKGTQAGRLCAELNLPHISTGDIFRENLRKGTELGLVAKGYMDRGELVPDTITDAMVEERLARPDVNEGFLLDGFPRTTAQAYALDEILARAHRRVAGAIHIHVSDDVLVMRLSGRMVCRQCSAPYHTFFNPPRREHVCDACGGELYQRSDDKPDTVRARLKTYHEQTEPLIAYFRALGVLHEIDGEADVDEISVRMREAIRPILARLNPAERARNHHHAHVPA